MNSLEQKIVSILSNEDDTIEGKLGSCIRLLAHEIAFDRREAARADARIDKLEKPTPEQVKTQVPTSFKLFGRTIVISQDAAFFKERVDKLGMACYDSGMIYLKPHTESFPHSEINMGCTFWHEVFHFLFLYAGAARNKDLELHSDEGFIDLLAQLMHQVITTMDFVNPSEKEED